MSAPVASPAASRVPAWLIVLAAAANAVAAALTFFLPDVLSGTDVMNGSARGTALIMLILGVPVLLSTLWLERRAPSWATIVRVGALAYLSYNGVMLLFGTPFNRLFLLYVVAMSSTVFALGTTLLRTDASAVAERLPRNAARIVGGYIMTIVVLNALLWLRTVVPATFADVPTSYLEGTGLTTNPIFVQDLVFWLPSAGLIGWLAWTRRTWGALLAGGYLVYGVLEAIGVATDQWFGSTADPASEVATMGGMYIFVVLAIVGSAALWFYARARAEGARSPAKVPLGSAA